jgi:hypothetical protein
VVKGLPVNAIPRLALLLAACAAPGAENTVPARWEARAPVLVHRQALSLAGAET